PAGLRPGLRQPLHAGWKACRRAIPQAVDVTHQRIDAVLVSRAADPRCDEQLQALRRRDDTRAEGGERRRLRTRLGTDGEGVSQRISHCRNSQRVARSHRGDIALSRDALAAALFEVVFLRLPAEEKARAEAGSARVDERELFPTPAEKQTSNG